MLVCKIWWVNYDKQHWKDAETGQNWKTVLGGGIPAIFVWDLSVNLVQIRLIRCKYSHVKLKKPQYTFC